ncbi:MAG: DUF5689 domain-containing protein [Rikenellaceae bacterium]
MLLAALAAVSCYDSFDPFTPSVADSSATANATLEALHTIYGVGVREITEDIIVEGTVSANDEHGNFYKCITLENDGYAIELLTGLYDSYVRYPIGSRLCLELNGLGLDKYYGVLRCGLVADATSSYSLDYISSEVLLDSHLTLTAYDEPIAATSLSLSELSEEHAGRLICISALTHHSDAQEQSSWEGYTLFRDAALDTLWCYTTSYSDFASQKIPQQEVSLCGILQYGSTDSYSNQFIIKMRSEEDCIY